jgi:hypothetical protein
MSKILGIIDALEATIFEAKKVPFSNKVILNEDELFLLIDKLRSVLKTEILQEPLQPFLAVSKNSQVSDEIQLNEENEKNEKIKNGADEYADFVLSNLQLAIIKMRKDLIKLESNIENGREVLDNRKKQHREIV